MLILWLGWSVDMEVSKYVTFSYFQLYLRVHHLKLDKTFYEC